VLVIAAILALRHSGSEAVKERADVDTATAIAEAETVDATNSA
jgi:hypothetical protein